MDKEEKEIYIDDLIKAGIRECNKLKAIIKKILKEEEKNNGEYDESMEYLSSLYKSTRKNIDAIVKTLLLKGGYFNVIDKINGLREKCSDFNKEGNYMMLSTYLEFDHAASKYNYHCSAFNNEYFKYLHLAYHYYYSKKYPLPEEYKDALRDVMAIEFASSDYMDKRFSGKIEDSINISSPEKTYGLFVTNTKVSEACYEELNNLVEFSNNCEMMEEGSSLDIMKLSLRLKFLAISTQMMDREIYFPCLDNPISDFTEEIMTDVISDSLYFSEHLDKNNLRSEKMLIKKLR